MTEHQSESATPPSPAMEEMDRIIQELETLQREGKLDAQSFSRLRLRMDVAMARLNAEVARGNADLAEKLEALQRRANLNSQAADQLQLHIRAAADQVKAQAARTKHRLRLMRAALWILYIVVFPGVGMYAVFGDNFVFRYAIEYRMAATPLFLCVMFLTWVSLRVVTLGLPLKMSVRSMQALTIVASALIAGAAVLAPLGWSAMLARVLGDSERLDGHVLENEEHGSRRCARKVALMIGGAQAHVCLSMRSDQEALQAGQAVDVIGSVSRFGVMVEDVYVKK